MCGTLAAQSRGAAPGRQQVEAKDTLCSRSCSSCAGPASGSACARDSRSLRRGERVTAAPRRSGAAPFGTLRTSGELCLHPVLQVGLCGGKEKAYLFLNSRKGSWWYWPQSWWAFSRKGNSSASIRLRWGQRWGGS